MVHSRWLTRSLVLAALLTRCKAFSFPRPLQTKGLGARVVSRPIAPMTSIGCQKHVTYKQSTVLTRRQLAIGDAIPALMQSLFRYEGTVPILEAFLFNALGFVVLKNKLLKMLTLQCFAHALFLGTMLWHKLGWRGWSLTVLYLFLGSAVTKVKFADKEKRGIAESRGGRRGPENLWGSAATGLACVICSKHAPIFGISSNLFVLGYVASMATKLSDTFASEIGKAYGKTTFLITTLERVEPGTEGAISAEGTAAALVGGLILSSYGWAIGLINAPSVGIAAVAAFLATNVESLLGATLQGKEGLKWITNEMVNFFNTLIGAALAIGGGMALL